MPPPTKFDMNKVQATPINGGAPSKFDMSSAIPLDAADDIDQNPAGEGTYQMVGKDGSNLHVPFSHVIDTGKAGFSITPDDFKRFTKDYTHTQGYTAEFDQLVSPSDESTWAGKGLNVFKGTASGLAAPFTHPKETTAGMGQPFVASGMAPGGMYPTTAATGNEADSAANARVQDEAQQGQAAQAKEIGKHPVYAASSAIGPAVVTAGAAKILPKVPGFEAITNLRDTALENVRQGLQNKFGGGKEFVEKKVENFKNENEKARTGMKHADEVGEAKRGAADDINKDRRDKHAEDTVEHGEKVQRKTEKHADRVAKWEKKKADTLKAHQDAVKQTHQDNAEALQRHIKETEEISKNNQAADAEMDARQALEQQHETLSEEFDKRVDAAEKKATTDNDAAWDVVRKKTAGQSTDISNLQKVTERAADHADPATSALFKRILKGEDPNLPALTRRTNVVRYVDSAGNAIDRQGISPAAFDHMVETGEAKAEPVTETVNPDDEGYGDLYEHQFGEPPPVGGGPAMFNRLQRWYSYISHKMYSGGGKVEPGLYRAYSMVRAAIDDAMQDIAQKSNAVPDLEKARKLHTEKMETFDDNPNEPATAASDVKKDTIPKRVKKTTSASKTAKVARYDPAITQLQEQIQSIDQRLGKMRTEEQLRAAKKPAPEPPKIKQPPTEPEIEPAPAPPEMPKPPKPPSTKPYPEPTKDRPSLPAAEDFTPERREELRENIKKFGATGQWAWRLILGTAGEIGLGLVGGHNPTAQVGRFGSGLIVGQGLMRLFSNIMRHDTILDWMARPSPEDLEIIDTLPPHDAERLRTAIKGLRGEESTRIPEPHGFSIAPGVAAFLGGQAAGTQEQHAPQSLEEIRKEAEKRKPQQQAAPGPQSSAQQPNWTHEYDEQTNSIRPVSV